MRCVLTDPPCIDLTEHIHAQQATGVPRHVGQVQSSDPSVGRDLEQDNRRMTMLLCGIRGFLALKESELSLSCSVPCSSWGSVQQGG